MRNLFLGFFGEQEKCKIIGKKPDIESYLVLDRNLLGSSRFPHMNFKKIWFTCRSYFLFSFLVTREVHHANNKPHAELLEKEYS